MALHRVQRRVAAREQPLLLTLEALRLVRVSIQKRATAMFGSWLYCSKNCHCSTCARSYGSSGTNCVPSPKYQRMAFDSASGRPSSSTSVGTRSPGVQLAENLRAVRAVDDRHLDRLVLDPELRKQETHLVAVARDRGVVEEHLDSVVGPDYAQPMAGAVKRLTDEELVQAMELARKSDSVELKLTVPATDHRAAIAALGLDPLEAQIRQVYFFDTPRLDLNGAGVVARARRIQGRAGDTVVKLRPVDPDDLPEELRRSPNRNGRGRRDARGLRLLRDAEDSRRRGCRQAAALGKTRLRKIFTKEQRAFFDEHAPAGCRSTTSPCSDRSSS